jgi:hypothetical protein
MKTLLLALSLVFAACSSPSEPDPQIFVNDETGITNIPQNTGTLQGIWADRFNCTLSDRGLYDPHYNVWMDTDLRVNGNRVWFIARGAASQKIFSGVIDGQVLHGYQQLSNWTPQQGITYTGDTVPYTYTLVK